MPKKRQIDLNQYGWKSPNKHLGVPWPRIGVTTEKDIKDVPLKEDYLLRSMDYLDTDAAKIIFEAQADIIVKNQIRGIIDVGCRIGRINDVLLDRGYTNYQYMGFDSSPEPIKYAKEVWSEFKNIEYRHANWNNLDELSVNFSVDCVIWSGVLLYRPHDHLDFFHKITVDFYSAKFAIIQEPLPRQKYWQPGLKLHTIADELTSYKKRYAYFSEEIIDAKIFSGLRKIVEIVV